MTSYFLVSLPDTSAGEAQDVFARADISVVREWELPADESDYVVVEAPSAERVVKVLGVSLERRRFGLYEISGVVTPEGVEQVSVGEALERESIPVAVPEHLPEVAPANAIPQMLVWCERCRAFRPARHVHSS